MQRDTLWLVSAKISTERRVLSNNWLHSPVVRVALHDHYARTARGRFPIGPGACGESADFRRRGSPAPNSD